MSLESNVERELLADIWSEIRSLRSGLVDALSRLDCVNARLDGINARVGLINQRIEGANSQLLRLDAGFSDLEADLEALGPV